MIRLAVFDLDGTLVRDRACVEAIARTIGREEECATFERLDMRDVIAVGAAREAMAEWYRPYTRMGADYGHGTRLIDGRVEHVWPADKGRWLRSLIARLDLPQQAVAAIGDSEGDRELLEAAGVRYCVGERKVEVEDVVHMPRASILEIAQRVVAEA